MVYSKPTYGKGEGRRSSSSFASPSCSTSDTALLDSEDVIPFSEKIGNKSVSQKRFDELLKTRWSRPSLEALDPTTDNLACFQIEVGSAIKQPSPCALNLYRGKAKEWKTRFLPTSSVQVIQIFGTTRDGISVLACIHGFFPYLYFQCPKNFINSVDVLKTTFNNFLQEGREKCDNPVLDVEIVKRRSLMHYTGNEMQNYCKVVFALPKFVPTLRTRLQQGIHILDPCTAESVTLPTDVFEGNIPFELRYMVDSKLPGCSWIEFPSGTYHARPPKEFESLCQIELDVFVEDVVVHQPVGAWQSLAPLRILSFDIECVTETGRGFPEPTKDRVIQIATVLTTQGSSVENFKVVFTLYSCSTVPGATVCWFDHESDMLSKWRDLVVGSDPDIITGYNCINFDLNYLLLRAKTLSLDNFKRLSRLKDCECKIRDSTLSSRGLGTHDKKDINIEGRVQMDMLEVIRRDYKLKSYTLNATAAEFLKEQKEDVHYSEIFSLFIANADTRRRIASYCLKDAVLPIRLMEKLLVTVNYVEMSRVTGTPLSFLLTRGQQIKVTSQLLRKCGDLGYLFPTPKQQGRGGDDREAAYEGATVLDPVKGFYEDPVATLDFASLYPSIMMAHNLCYSTLCVDSIDKLQLKEDDVTCTPTKAIFVKRSIRQGVLPLIVEELIAARKKARKEMETQTEPMTKMVLNGRQLALKLSANSVYGYTGAVGAGQLPCVEVSAAITAYGRDMIESTRDFVMENFTQSKGYPRDALVLYGDTDSVMIDFGVKDLEQAMALGKQAAAFLTQKFIPPIKLEFEKVFSPFLLMNKKRYAGLLYTNPAGKGRLETKGIETVRRDFCLLVQQLVDTVLKKILIERDVEGAKDYTRQIISNLLQNKIDLSLLVLSKSLGKEDYANKLAHNELAKKLKARDPGSAPQVGDRVHFVIVPGHRNQPQYDRAEDPLYVLQNNLSIDTQYYVDNIKNPIVRIFEGVMDHPETLFGGSHTLQKKVLTSSTSAMAKFVKASLRCVGCRMVIHEGAFCAHCKDAKEREVVIEKMDELKVKEFEFNELWVQCQRCQESTLQNILCTSRDCPIYYRRMKIQKDIGEVQAQVDRISIDALEW